MTHTALATHAPSFAAQPPPAFLVAQLPPPALIHPCHAIFVRHGREIATSARIEDDLSLTTICPTFEASWFHKGRRRTQVYPHLRSYVLARWPSHDPHLWHALNDIPDVVGFIGGISPIDIPERDVTTLLARVAEVATTPSDFRRPRPPLDSLVNIVLGPFAGQTGRVVRAPAPPPIVVLEINGILSRSVVVEVPISCCDPIVAVSLPWERTQRRRRSRRGKTGILSDAVGVSA